MAAGPRIDPGLAHPECQLKHAARRPWRRCAQRPRHQLHRDDSLFSNLLVANRTNAEIAQTLFLSEKTVSVHVSNLLRKTDTGSRREVAALARRVGWGTGGCLPRSARI